MTEKKDNTILKNISIKSSALVSIIIPCYNQAQYLEEAVESAVNQTYSNIEIIIINDGSTDNTGEVASVLQQKYPNIQILTQANSGVSVARNNGIDMANGGYIVALDGDDILVKEMVAQCMNAMQENEADVIYTDLQCFGIVDHIVKKKPFSENNILYENLPPPMSLYKKEVWATVNGYKHNMDIGYEDWEFWINIYKHGFKFHYHPEIMALYRVKEESRDTAAVKKDVYLKAKIIMNHPKLYPEKIQKYAIQTIKNEENKIKYYFYHDTNLEELELLNLIVLYFSKTPLPNGEIVEINQQKIGIYPLEIIQNSDTIPKLYIDKHHLNGLCFFSLLRFDTPHDVKPCTLALDHSNKLVSTEGTLFPFVYHDILVNPELQKIALGHLHDFQAKQPVFQTTEALVSVVVPCFNQAQYLPDSIRSIAEQTYKHLEIIIVNDGSTDNTLEVAQELTLRYLHCNIRIINQTNMGLSEARNSGIQTSRGIYILPLDADDKLHPTMVNKCVYALRQHDVEIVYGDYQRFGEENTIQKTGENVHLYFIQYANITGATALYKKTVWETLGGYKKNMFGGYEDWEFWVNATKNSFQFHHLSEVLFYYRVKKESMYVNAAQKHTYLCSKIVMNHPELYTDRERYDAIVSIKQFEQTPELYFYFDKTIVSNEKGLIETVGKYIENNNIITKLQQDEYHTIFSSNHFGTISLSNLKIINSLDNLDEIKEKNDVDCIVFYSALKHDTTYLSITTHQFSRFAWSQQKGCIPSEGTQFPFISDSDPQLKIKAYKRSEKYHYEQYHKLSTVVKAYKNKSLNENDINNIRDAALIIENSNIQLAYDLMSIAHNARPSGPFIKQKLDEYKSRLSYK